MKSGCALTKKLKVAICIYCSPHFLYGEKDAP